jgi:hypothetical protein
LFHILKLNDIVLKKTNTKEEKMSEILIVLIVLFAIYLLYKVLSFLKKKGVFDSDKIKNKIKVKKDKSKPILSNVGTVSLVDKYMYRREVNALIALNKVLPRQYITLPKVSIANLVMPEGTRNLYNTIKEYFVDFVIFEEATMKPVLIVDVYDNSFEDELLKYRHPDLIEVLNQLKLDCVEIAVRGDIDLELLKNKLFKALDLEEKPSNKENKQ